MKNNLLFAFCLFAVLSIKAQTVSNDTVDPFLGNYILGNSAELVFQFAPDSGAQSRWIYDFNSDSLKLKYKQNYAENYEAAGKKETAVITGDFNADDKEDIVSAWECANHSIALSIPEINVQNLNLSGQNVLIIDSVFKSSLKLLSGNFDTDPKNEIILSFLGLDNYLHIILYKTDAFFNITKISEIDNYALSTDSFFDITTGDFDVDGFDELAAINPYALNYVSDYEYLIRSKIMAYDYDISTKTFISKKVNDVSVMQNLYQRDCFGFQSLHLSGVSITSGDYNADGIDEVAYGSASDRTCWYRGGIVNNGVFINLTIVAFQGTLDSVRYDQNNAATLVDNEATPSPPSGLAIDLISHDMNNDRIDEIISYTFDKLCIFKVSGNNMELTEAANFPATSRYETSCDQLMAIADVNADTLSNNLNYWIPEIVIVKFIKQGPNYYPYIPVSSNYIYISLLKPVLNAENQITGISAIASDSTGILGYKTPSVAIALGDFNGDAVRLGHPTVGKKSILVPTIVMNAPPFHFDILDGKSYDINTLYGDDGSDDWNTSYARNDETSTTSSTELIRDWGVSTELAAGGGFWGIKVSASLTASYGEKFSKTSSTTATAMMQSFAAAQKDDIIYGLNTDYYLYEYPVYHNRETKGNILVSIPILRGHTWEYSQDVDFSTYSLTHEPGNLISYPFYNSISDNPDLIEGQNTGNIYAGDIFALSDAKPPSWTLDVSKLETGSIAKTKSFDIGMSASVSAWGCSASVKGDYSQDNLASHQTSIKNGFIVNSSFGKIDLSLGEFRYKLNPYVYWSKKGAMVVDYNVDLTGLQWMLSYGYKPDPAFILPFKYGPEKGNSYAFESKRIRTSDIRYFPFDAKPKDTVTVLATVRNFCLFNPERDNTAYGVKVRFYLGDPADGGELITSLDKGESDLNFGPIAPRSYKTGSFRWVMPSEIPEKPWIFAIIDPDDKIKDEIHPDNNKAWIPLFGTSKHPPYIPLTTGADENFNTNYLEVSNYPNPACNGTTIIYNLKDSPEASLVIYNCFGQKLDKRDLINDSAGMQSILLDLSAYTPGIYFYQLISGKHNVTKKMVVQ